MGTELGHRIRKLSNSFRLNFLKNVPKRLPAEILRTVDIVFAKVKIAD